VKDVKIAFDLAERYDRRIDLHIDETDDPGSRFTEVLASEAIKRDMGDRTTASHTTAMHSYPNSYASKVTALLAESGATVVTNPPDNSVLQGGTTTTRDGAATPASTNCARRACPSASATTP